MDPTGGKSDRFIRLYPKVDKSETPLPRSWNPKDKYSYIGLSNSNLKVHYKGKLVCVCVCGYQVEVLDVVSLYQGVAATTRTRPQ